jgi:hypothetical protein
MERGPDFLQLAHASSALYPSGSHEKRRLDAISPQRQDQAGG